MAEPSTAVTAGRTMWAWDAGDLVAAYTTEEAARHALDRHLRMRRSRPEDQTIQVRSVKMNGGGPASLAGVPPQRLRGLVRLLGPGELTLTAKRQLEKLAEECDQEEYDQEEVAAPSAVSSADGGSSATYPDGTTVRLWRFQEAPEYLRLLSRNGGDEDWVVSEPVAIHPDAAVWHYGCAEDLAERLAVMDAEAAQSRMYDEFDNSLGLAPPPEVEIDGVLSRVWITCHA